jgi:hypothetical protein
MGSRLYSRWEVSKLLDSADLELTAADHDFAFPFGLYREIPNRLESTVRARQSHPFEQLLVLELHPTG